MNDLLDLAKVEAGKLVVRAAEFEARNLFGALRGMLRPLLLNTSVNLVFEEPEGIPTLCTDEGKVSQILRNFISNALKFTEQGEVRVSVRLSDDGRQAVFSVADTGIGIAPEHQAQIFEKFGRVAGNAKPGTGLGLFLSRSFAEAHGGSLAVDSALGQGAVFTLTLPVS